MGAAEGNEKDVDEAEAETVSEGGLLPQVPVDTPPRVDGPETLALFGVEEHHPEAAEEGPDLVPFLDKSFFVACLMAYRMNSAIPAAHNSRTALRPLAPVEGVGGRRFPDPLVMDPLPQRRQEGLRFVGEAAVRVAEPANELHEQGAEELADHRLDVDGKDEDRGEQAFPEGHDGDDLPSRALATSRGSVALVPAR
eukprot:CAMPEP_0185753622 /NCGR_PEP_ID=MMETSP1174-20130828/12348_1 /TAXON_ID=35687 /ORGANISM="Dictyocha speculum, Strain CCMP1381" /LENGTH=195 /DNA_ID=CAMNT_0028431555 /DNA_START=62 /DNA_END=652 /DNA_ORIENTATION=+